MKDIIYFGGNDVEESLDFANRDYLKELLGGKGAVLAEMSSLGISVPPGFTISTRVCKEFLSNGEILNQDEIENYIKKLEQNTGKIFGDKNNFLLVSVRSGAKISMPGMMDTVLNIGLNDEILSYFEEKSEKEEEIKWLYDCYRRLLQMYGSVVMGINSAAFEEIIEDIKLSSRITKEQDFSIKQIKRLIEEFKETILLNSGMKFPQNVKDQLLGAIKAVFSSWNSPRAILYRKIHNISNDLGTAVNVQSMVFGNFDKLSGTGVLFTRNPSTGKKEFFGEFLASAQGEDVVSGIRTPEAIESEAGESLKNKFPHIYQELCTIAKRLEKHFKDMQDIEFTVEKGKLWILQSRSGKRSIAASIKIALDMVEEGLITEKEAILRVDSEQINSLLHDSLDEKYDYKILTKGLPASPGAVSGRIAFTAERAVEMAKESKVILVRQETCPEDIHGMHVAEGILTSRGGMTSHAAVVARGMGKTCVCGAIELDIDVKRKSLKKGDIVLSEGSFITIDGASGSVIIGEVPTVKSLYNADLMKMILLAKKYKKLGVRANAETVIDAKAALSFGAEGIGLCRTEHMFFAVDRILEMRKMILSENNNERLAAVNKLGKMQKEDFISLLEIMSGAPLNIRLLDPPLHEFISVKEEEIISLASTLEKDLDKLKKIIIGLKEENPMLGHRGCRLGISYPELYQMQVKSIVEAAKHVQNKGVEINIEIMIPLVMDEKELILLRKDIEEIISGLNIKIGTMIELPRACLVADKLAPYVDYFSFGTNDLTQTVLGISRDDSGRFLNDYLEKEIFDNDPFIEIDIEGVGDLIQMAIKRASAVKKNLSFSVCGEHGGNKKSIDFFHQIGMNYVSASPYRVPAAIIAAAQKNINENNR